MSNTKYNQCGCCGEETKGFYKVDKSADRDDLLFICHSCGNLMTNSQDNLDYYNRLIEIFGTDQEDVDKCTAFENHFQKKYESPKIERMVRKCMFDNGRWVTN